MGGPKSKATQEEISAAFKTGEPFKAIAARIGMSPNTLRKKWKAEFGEEAYLLRGKQIQAKAAARVSRDTAHSRVYKSVEVICSKCHKPILLKSNQVAQMAVSAFVCKECRYDRKCPVCGLLVSGIQGLSRHFNHRSEAHDQEHIDYELAHKDDQWIGKSESEDYVVCKECGHKAKTLARHLKAVHNITADQYKNKYGQHVLIRALSVTESLSNAAKQRKGSHGKGDTKQIKCPVCGVVWEGSKFLVQGTHDFRCESCRKQAEDDRWDDKSDPEDYVTCLDCGYRAESLISHFQNKHPDYRKRHPNAPIVALNSAVRDKSSLKGILLSAETRQKMSDNAGRWNKGLTKGTDPRVALTAEKLRGRLSWNKGLTASSDERIQRTSEKLKMYVGEDRPWDNGLAANLTLEDFTPFMDSDGRVDHHSVIAATGLSWVTVRKWICDIGLEQSRRYIENAADIRTIRLDKETLEQFCLANGKVSIGRAMVGLGHNFKVIKRECERHELPTFHRHIRQSICLDAVSKALGGVPYVEEWHSRRFVNPVSDYMFKFDGYYESIGLICEFQGYLHYTFPNVYHPDESYRPLWEAMVERDRVKKALINAAPDLIFFEVREDEPYDNADYLKGRLVQAGLLAK